jgi:hypothetical protein
MVLYYYHGLISYKDTKIKCRHLKKLTCKGTLRQLFIRVYINWRYSQSCWYFRSSFVNYCTSDLFSGSPSPPPLPSVKVQYIHAVIHAVRLGGGAGVLSCVGAHIM